MSIDRRQFLGASLFAGAGSVLPNHVSTEITDSAKFKSPNGKIGIGVIGVGARGRNHVEQLLYRDDCEVVAINDIDPMSIEACKKIFEKANRSLPSVYLTDEFGYKELIANKAVDAILIATPWEWHTEMCIAGMKGGKYTATEVCGGFSVDECWELVNTHEATGSHLFFLENGYIQ